MAGQPPGSLRRSILKGTGIHWARLHIAGPYLTASHVYIPGFQSLSSRGSSELGLATNSQRPRGTPAPEVALSSRGHDVTVVIGSPDQQVLNYL